MMSRQPGLVGMAVALAHWGASPHATRHGAMHAQVHLCYMLALLHCSCTTMRSICHWQGWQSGPGSTSGHTCAEPCCAAAMQDDTALHEAIGRHGTTSSSHLNSQSYNGRPRRAGDRGCSGSCPGAGFPAAGWHPAQRSPHNVGWVY
jgi:hypothetical protein